VDELGERGGCAQLAPTSASAYIGVMSEVVPNIVVVREEETEGFGLCAQCIREKNAGINGRVWWDDEEDSDKRVDVTLPLDEEGAVTQCSYGHEVIVVRLGSEFGKRFFPDYYIHKRRRQERAAQRS
jgi:hypothetical protein